MGVEEVRQALRAKYTELTPEDFKSSAGDRSKLVKIIAEKKGISEEDVQKEVDAIFAEQGM